MLIVKSIAQFYKALLSGNPPLRSRGRGFVISMHLCKEYARSTTTNADNKRNIYKQVRELNIRFCVTCSLDSNRVARTSRVFKIGIERELVISAETHVFIRKK